MEGMFSEYSLAGSKTRSSPLHRLDWQAGHSDAVLAAAMDGKIS